MPIADLTDRAGDEAPQEGERGGRGGLGDDGGGGGRGEAGVHGVVVRGRAALALAASRAAAAEDAATPGPTTHRVLVNPIGDMKKQFRTMPPRRCRQNSVGDHQELVRPTTPQYSPPPALLNEGDWKVIEHRTRQS